MRSDSAPFVLRAARPEDGDAVAALCAALSAHEGGPTPALSAEAFRRDGFGPEAAFACVVAEGDGRPVGYAMHLADYDTDLLCHGTYLADLYVDTRARRCGIGGALLAAVSRITAERGGKFVRWNVLRGNPSARAFYGTLASEKDHLLLYGTVGEHLAWLAAESPPPGLTVRQALRNDLPALAKLVTVLRAHEGFGAARLDVAARLADDGFGDRPAFLCHLAERDGKVVGYALHWVTYDTEPAAQCGYLSDLFVVPAHRRRGVARALMAAVARHWLARGAPWIEWKVRRDNHAACRFYDTVAHAYPDVLPMIAGGEAFDALARRGVALR